MYEIELDEIEGVDNVLYSVIVEVTPGIHRPASFYGHPDSWYPDESEPAEIVSVHVVGYYDEELGTYVDCEPQEVSEAFFTQHSYEVICDKVDAKDEYIREDAMDDWDGPEDWYEYDMDYTGGC